MSNLEVHLEQLSINAGLSNRLSVICKIEDIIVDADSADFDQVGEGIVRVALSQHTGGKRLNEALLRALKRAIRVDVAGEAVRFAELFYPLIASSGIEVSGDSIRAAAVDVSLVFLDAVLLAVAPAAGADTAPAYPECVSAYIKLIGRLLLTFPAPSRTLTAVVHRTKATLLEKHKLLSLLADLWLSAEALAQSPYCFSALALFATRDAPATSQVLPTRRVRANLSRAYSQQVLGAKSVQALPASLLARLKRFVSSLSVEEWSSVQASEAATSAEGGSGAPAPTESLEALALRLLKKAPEGSSQLIRAICADLEVPLDSFAVNGGVTGGLRMLKSTSPEIRANGRAMLVSTFFKCATVEAIQASVGELLAVHTMRGSSTPEQRAEVSIVLAAIGDLCVSRQDVGDQVAQVVAPGLLQAMLGPSGALSKETDDGARFLLARAAGPWLASQNAAMACIPLRKPLEESLSPGSKSLLPHLIALSTACERNPAFLAHLDNLWTPLALLLAKPIAANRNECTLALRVLLQACAGSEAAALAAGKNKLWNVLVSESSYVNSIPAFLSADYDESDIAAAGARALEAAITEARCAALAEGPRGGLELFANPAEPSFPCSTLVTCLLHPVASVRRTVASRCRDLQQSSCNATVALVKAVLLQVHRNSLSMQNSQPSPTNFKDWATSASAYQAAAALAIPSNRVAAVLVALMSNADTAAFTSPCAPAAELLAAFLLLSCHSGVNAASQAKSRSLWVNCHVERLTVDANTVFGDAASVQLVSARLLDACRSPSVELRSAASSALSLLSAIARESAVGHWSTSLWSVVAKAMRVSLADASQYLQALSAEDLRLFLDPAGVLAEVASAAQAKLADVRITNADRKKTESRTARKGAGSFGADLADDEDWASKIKEEKLLKAKEAAGAATDAATAEIRARIEEVSATVGSRQVEAKGLMTSLTSMLSNYEAGAEAACSEILSSVLPLLTNQLVETEAISLLHCLVDASLGPAMSASGVDVSNALLAVATSSRESMSRQQKIVSDAAFGVERMQRIMRSSAPFVRTLRMAAIAASRAAGAGLSAAVFSLLFPILECLLSLPATVPGCDMAFTVFADSLPSNAELGPVLQPALQLCLRTLRKPRVDPKPEGVMLRLLSNCCRIGDWEPLFGALGLFAEEADVRQICVRILDERFKSMAAAGIAPIASEEQLYTLSTQLLMAQCDSAEACAAQGVLAWKSWTVATRRADGGLPAEAYLPKLLALFSHKSLLIRTSAARAVAQGAQLHPSSVQGILQKLQTLYSAALPEILANVRGARAAADDGAPSRLAVAVALAALAANKCLVDASLPAEAQRVELMRAVSFMSTVGAGDKSADVRESMVSAGRATVDSYGEANVQALLQFFGAELSRSPSTGENMDAYDARHEAAVVLLGAAGKFIPADDLERTQSIVRTLIDALKTPSEGVQTAVADCLTPLVQRLKGTEAASAQLEALIVAITDANTYGERRGAAFGVSAFVKGLGIGSLKAHDVVGRLRDSCEKGENNARQGALGAFECLSARLGLLFEPYVVTIVPVLLKSFSHASDHVREAAQVAARAIMGRLSAHGIKQVLTPILASLPNEPAWKSRQESIRLLGTMAHCAPKQLSSCLPQIVPRLVEAGSDAHPKVKESAKLAMEDIATVIRNPEVSRLGPMLLSALSDPANKTKAALESLLECEFMHSIDAPSLALLVPILSRALRDRGADLKRKSSAITGNMVSMVSDSKFLLPYLPQLLPGLKDCLIDPIPDVRAIASKALGSLMGGVGEVEEMQELIPWLMLTLCNESSPVERSGAAQGLSEVCAALGEARLADVLQQTLPLRNSHAFAAREGLLWLLSFLPPVVPQHFARHISVTLPVLLGGLSDSAESVREIALRAGQVMVSSLGRSNSADILPALRSGMFDDDWHIRHASILLVGELLYLVGDTKGAIGVTEEDDDDEGAEENNSTAKVYANIKAHLGVKLTESILASLYISRSDISSPCRQSALQVWKSIVTNTPRVMVEVMSEMVLQLVTRLASDSEDMRLVAGRALGDCVTKLGDRILPTVMPYMSRGLTSPDAGMRQGVCLGLAEILNSSSKRQIEDYVDVLIPALEHGFCDPSEAVRKQAAKAFQTLFKAIGVISIGTIVPALMSRIKVSPRNTQEQEDSNIALLGLQELLNARPRDIVEYIVPAAVKSPMSIHGCFILGGLAPVGGRMLQYHVPLLVMSFVRELSRLEELASAGDADARELHSAVSVCASKCMASFTGEAVYSVMQDLAMQIDNDQLRESRRWGCWLLDQFVAGSKAEYREYLPLMLKVLLSRVAETYVPLLEALRGAMNSIANSVPLDYLLPHIEFMRSCVSSTVSDARFRFGGDVLLNAQGEVELPLFNLPKALEPFLVIYNHGLVTAASEKREVCAEAMGELFLMTEQGALKPYLIKTTGPLIRVVGDRFPSSVKTAILGTLCVLLGKGGVALKAFAPQLQTTFVKALSDASIQTRRRAVSGLGLLTGISARTDGLLNELANACSAAESNAIRASILDAMGETLRGLTAAPSAASVDKVRSTVIAYLLTEEEAPLRVASCATLRILAAYMETELLVDCLSEMLGQVGSRNWPTAVGALAGSAAVFAGASAEKSESMRSDIFEVISSALSDDRPAVRIAASNAAGVLWAPNARDSPGASTANAALAALAERVARVAGDTQNDDDVRKRAVIALKAAAKGASVGVHQLNQRLIVRFAPPLIKALRELDPQLQYFAGRALHYLFRKPKGSTALAEAIGNTSDTEIINFLRDYQRRAATIQEDEDSGEEI